MLPVLLAPYGGPGHQEVLAAGSAYLESQWFADQGFAVVIADGRGTPGRGPQWDRAIFGDLAGPVLDDQVAALHAAAERFSDLDLRRVGIRGWSFGGYLAALAVLRRPDAFHAAIAGAPVTEWRLYDTHYTERYLGHPDESKEAYERCSLLADAPRLARPLLLIHGLADDNVVAAHTLRLSSALLAAGRPHNVLPLPGVTHMASQEEVTENLLLVQADFLRHSLEHGAVEPGSVSALSNPVRTRQLPNAATNSCAADIRSCARSPQLVGHISRAWHAFAGVTARAAVRYVVRFTYLASVAGPTRHPVPHAEMDCNKVRQQHDRAWAGQGGAG